MEGVMSSVRSAVVALVVALVPTGALAHAGTAAAASPGYTVTTRDFTVVVGPNNDQTCTIVGDLYVPTTASPSSPVPAILTTNGFGGS